MSNTFLLKDDNSVQHTVKSPVIEKTCVGCGRCVSACPAHTITLRQVRRRDGTFARRAKIHSNRCIRCFCCQELCPHRCVRIHKNLLLRFLG